MMCTYALASSSEPPRSDHDRIEGDISARVKDTEYTDTNGRRNAGILWEFRLKSGLVRRRRALSVFTGVPLIAILIDLAISR